MPHFLSPWFPVTSDFGLVAASLPATVDAYVQWQAAIGHTFAVHELTDGLATSLETLAPLSVTFRRTLFVPTTAAWTAFFRSGIQGSDPAGPMPVLSEILGVQTMRICSTEPTAAYPAVCWEVFAPRTAGGDRHYHRRSICAMNDGGRWVFLSVGAPFPFEDVALYSVRRKRDRFNHATLASYLSHFQLHPFEEAFYTSGSTEPSVLLDTRAPDPIAVPEFTFEEVADGKPWSRSA